MADLSPSRLSLDRSSLFPDSWRKRRTPSYGDVRYGLDTPPAPSVALAPPALEAAPAPKPSLYRGTRTQTGATTSTRGGNAYGVTRSGRGDTNPNGAVDLGTVRNEFATGGDGTIAPTQGIQRSDVSFEGSDRDEIMRRMANVAGDSRFKGSPSMRAAMAGAYADKLKAMDERTLQNNKGNIDAGLLTFQQSNENNRQTAAGRQAFGNQAGLLNIERNNALELAAASSDPEKRQLELDKIRSGIAVDEANAMNKKAETDAMLPAKQEALFEKQVETEMKSTGLSYAEARRVVAARSFSAGTANTDRGYGAEENVARAKDLAGMVNQGNSFLDQTFAGETPHLFDPTVDASTATLGNFREAKVGGLTGAVNEFLGRDVGAVEALDENGNPTGARSMLKGEQLARFRQIMADDAKAKERAKRAGVK